MQHTPPDSQAITRLRRGKVERSWPRDSVVIAGDRFVVGRRTDARVSVDGKLGQGRVVLSAELGRCSGSDIGRHIVGRTTSLGRPTSLGTGSYEIRKDTVVRSAVAQERFVVVVRNGAAVVQWRSGELSVRALNEQIRDLGSVFTVLVDSAANRGIVTVQEGLVTLRSGALSVGPGQSFTFGPGQPIQPVTVFTAGLDEIRVHSEEIWKNPRKLPSLSWVPRPPVPSLPWKYIIGGTVGATAAGYGAWKIWGEKGPPPPPPVRAIIVISIPL